MSGKNAKIGDKVRHITSRLSGEVSESYPEAIKVRWPDDTETVVARADVEVIKSLRESING